MIISLKNKHNYKKRLQTENNRREEKKFKLTFHAWIKHKKLIKGQVADPYFPGGAVSIQYSVKLSPKWYENIENCAGDAPRSANSSWQIEFSYLLKFISPNYEHREPTVINSLGLVMSRRSSSPPHIDALKSNYEKGCD